MTTPQNTNTQNEIDTTQSEGGIGVPTATITPSKSHRFLYLIPLTALILAAALATTYLIKLGPIISVTIPQGFGLKPDDTLRCRGIAVGHIQSLKLTPDTQAVTLKIRLQPHAKKIARTGSQFWVVRPQLSLDAITGLDTLTGPQYLAVLPGAGEPQSKFQALDAPPILQTLDPDGLEITLLAQQRAGLKPGAPIYYKQSPVGSITSVALASDATAIIAHAYIEPAYAPLIRTNSKFWPTSRAQIDLGITGLNVRVDSLQSLLVGGLTLATPQSPGARVSTGHRFNILTKPDNDALEANPSIAIGANLLPHKNLPKLHRASVTINPNGLFDLSSKNTSWMLTTPTQIIAPADILPPPSPTNSESDTPDQLTLQIAGQTLPNKLLAPKPLFDNSPLTVTPLNSQLIPTAPLLSRSLNEPEDCVIFTDSTDSAIPLDATRLGRINNQWAIDPTITLPKSLHGAAILARKDAALLGILLLTKNTAHIAPIQP